MAQGREFARSVRSFRYAFRGVGTLLRGEVNARIHALATATAVVAGFAFDIERLEWALLVLTIASVWSLEAVNTAIEAACNAVSTERHPRIEQAKDVAAAAVLIAALASIVVAGLIFGPRLLALATS